MLTTQYNLLNLVHFICRTIMFLSNGYPGKRLSLVEKIFISPLLCGNKCVLYIRLYAWINYYCPICYRVLSSLQKQHVAVSRDSSYKHKSGKECTIVITTNGKFVTEVFRMANQVMVTA
jgi:hypothetical protein